MCLSTIAAPGFADHPKCACPRSRRFADHLKCACPRSRHPGSLITRNVPVHDRAGSLITRNVPVHDCGTRGSLITRNVPVHDCGTWVRWSPEMCLSTIAPRFADHPKCACPRSQHPSSLITRNVPVHDRSSTPHAKQKPAALRSAPRVSFQIRSRASAHDGCIMRSALRHGLQHALTHAPMTHA
jgi:hypothetical protein